MLGGTYLLTKLLLPALEKAACTTGAPPPSTTSDARGGDGGSDGGGGGKGARVINVSSGGMYTVSGAGIADDIDSEGVEPYDGTVV